MLKVSDLSSRFFIVAHRGASAYEPENTMRSFRHAVKLGCKAVEFDVRLSKDGYPIIIHDETVDRTTNGHGRVNELSLEELKALDAGLGEKIPLLDEVLDNLSGRAVFFIELKVDDAVKPVLEAVEDRDLWGSVLFISFKPFHLREILNYNSDAYVGLIYFKSGDGIVTARRIGAIAVLPYYRFASKRAVAFAKKLGLMIIPWTVDDISVAKKLKSYGVNGVATNKPDLLLSLEDNYS
ncbi:MAG: hypothetical protein J7J22_05200 [Candidatus Verstraetearchaeota archaeon]|nr:hypothetical protein [Candidatus Verstraetearchaeota archaeon]